ncbi:hypothetical protein Lnau_0665 [Legionella nautarum]|uniref:Polymerase nucleotidyl transferase domain-containing protein n=1 Tax=Legionella nautarum TaxID=45070 RepID=A0A0W0WYU0_9GAMM|nr:nucleotidyltransferase domain-containing protein [Legionella nautarum]KTD37475.1 hypothetical protein Lnau_0665 [Legionella nautarum]
MDINEFVTHLAKEITPQGVLCYGSYAQMLQDNKSDIDLLVLVNNVIPQDNLREITYSKFPDTKIVSLGKNMGDWDVSWTPVNDCLMIGDQAIDIGYNTTEWVNRVIENLIIKNQITFDEFPFRPYTFLGLLETCKILYDKNHFIASCQSKISPMPHGLKKEIIHSYLPILRESYEELVDYSQRDIGILAYQFQLFRGLDAIINILCAINDTYDPASKRTEVFLFKLKKQPPDLHEFINKVLPRFFENKNEVSNYFKSSISFIEKNIG